MAYISRIEKRSYHGYSFFMTLIMFIFSILTFDIFSIIYSMLYALFIFHNDAPYMEKSKIIISYKNRQITAILEIIIVLIYNYAICLYIDCGYYSAVNFFHSKAIILILTLIILFIVYFKSKRMNDRRKKINAKYYYIMLFSLVPILNFNLTINFYISFINILINIILIIFHNKISNYKLLYIYLLMFLISIVSFNFYSTIVIVDIINEQKKSLKKEVIKYELVK